MIYGRQDAQQTAETASPEKALTQDRRTAAANVPVQQTADPYDTYGRQMREDYATTLADIRKRRQAMEERYQPDIDRQRKMMKIVALGKLLGALGQFAGGGRGKIVKDTDPYQINAWKRLEATKAEKRAYDRQFDAEELAARKGMQQGLSRLTTEKAKSMQRIAELAMKTELKLKEIGANAEIKAAFEKLKHDNAVAMQNAKTAGQVAVVEANMRRDAAKLAQQAANNKARDDRRHEQKTEQIKLQGEENRKTKSTPSGGTTITYNGKGTQKPEGFGTNNRKQKQDNFVQM